MTSRPPQETSPEKIRVHIDPSLQELIPNFLSNRRHDVDSLRQALTEDNFPFIQTLAHRMKGDGGGYGFDGISEIGAILEAAAERKDRHSITRQTNKLADYLERLQVVYLP